MPAIPENNLSHRPHIRQLEPLQKRKRLQLFGDRVDEAVQHLFVHVSADIDLYFKVQMVAFFILVHRWVTSAIYVISRNKRRNKFSDNHRIHLVHQFHCLNDGINRHHGQSFR